MPSSLSSQVESSRRSISVLSETADSNRLSCKKVKILTNFFINAIERKKDYETVKKAFDAIPVDRRSELVYSRFILFAVNENRYEDAKAIFHQALAENKTKKIDHHSYSKIALDNEDFDEFYRVYQLSSAAGFLSWRTKMQYTDLFLRKGKIEEAKSIYQDIQAEMTFISEIASPKIGKHKAVIDLHGYSHGAGLLAFDEFMMNQKLPNKVDVITGKGKREDNHLVFRNYMFEKIQEELKTEKLKGWKCVVDPENEGVLQLTRIIPASSKNYRGGQISRIESPRGFSSSPLRGKRSR